ETQLPHKQQIRSQIKYYGLKRGQVFKIMRTSGRYVTLSNLLLKVCFALIA
ncbi:hypothetical protein RhiirA5_346573, partial [Rhizophagus irregularis]